jgi:hypothetical protein
MKRIAATSIVLLVLALACSLTPNNTDNTDNSLSQEDMVATSTSATLTAIAGEQSNPEGSPVPQQPAEDTPVPQPTNTPPPACQPLHPGAQMLDLPFGLGLTSGGDPDVVNFYDIMGASLGTKNLAEFAWPDVNQVHFAGGNTAGFPNLPIVYHSMFVGGEVLRLNVNNAISDLGSAPQLVTITGAEAQPYIAYTLNTTGTSGWISYLYASIYSGVGTTAPMMARDEGDGYVIWPLAVHFSGGAAQGIWYTESLYGIGNINFQPFKGLYYFNLSDSSVTPYLPADSTVAGFSPDQTWVAYTPGVGDSPGQAQGAITLKNLITCQEVTLPFDQPTNLGGWLEFSPDNQYVAWLETFGPSPMQATFRVRAAMIDGTSLVNAELSTLTGLLGGVAPEYVLPPMKWVDNHVLGLSLRPTGGSDSVFVIWAPDPAQLLNPVLGANQSAPIGDGKLIGLLYP